MKKTIKTIAMAAHCILFSIGVPAQVPLKVGDKVPDVTISNITNFKSTTAKLSDFKGKLLIIDFWATWCSPCISMVPKHESLQKQFDGKVQILPVTYQSKGTVEPALNRINKERRALLPEVTSDKVLHNLFPHKYLPHYVWIDPEGLVVNITSYQDVTAENIQSALQGTQLDTKVKQDKMLKYDPSQPILIGASMNGSIPKPILYSSAFAKYIPGVSSGYRYVRKDSTDSQKILFRNCSIVDFYQAAYSRFGYFQRNRVVFEVMDRTPFSPPKIRDELEGWMEKYTFNYELVVPKAIGEDMFRIMQVDSKKYFPQYTCAVENRSTKVLALIRTSTLDKLKTKGGTESSKFEFVGARMVNFPLIRLVAELNTKYLQSSPFPIIDETGYTGRVDLNIEANLMNVQSINQALAQYDLKLVEKDATVPMLIIRDGKEAPTSVTN